MMQCLEESHARGQLPQQLLGKMMTSWRKLQMHWTSPQMTLMSPRCALFTVDGTVDNRELNKNSSISEQTMKP